MTETGSRFGPQGIREIFALYGPYNVDLGVDLRESVIVTDVGDVFTIPGVVRDTLGFLVRAGHLPRSAGE